MATDLELQCPTPELDGIFVQAQHEHAAGRLEEAAAAYREFLVRRPGSAQACNNLGNVLIAQGHINEATAQYERAIALEPRLVQARTTLATFFVAKASSGRP